MEVKKDLAMRQQRRFSNDLKRQIIEELISGASRPAQLCRRHEIAPSLLYHWKKQYNLGKLDNEPIKEAAMQDRIEKLERFVGKLTLE
jgi:transposase-like protein